MLKSKNNKEFIFAKTFFSIFIPCILILFVTIATVSISVPNRSERIDIYTEQSTIVSIFTPIILVSSLVPTVLSLQHAYKKYENDVLINRRKNGFEFLNSIMLGKFVDVRKEFESIGINPYKSSYLLDKELISDKSIFMLRDIFNIFELICIGINYQVIDEDMAYNQLSEIMLSYWRWGEVFVIVSRMRYVSSTSNKECDDLDKYDDLTIIYRDYEKQAYEWEQRRKKEREPMEEKISFKEWRKQWKNKEVKYEDKKMPLEEVAKRIYDKSLNQSSVDED